ncbi:MAG: hypothetical protein P4K83_02185 [Terracidiphilus sp.]|nr:hypothetical protein [Terracidiphilus sp.]
MTGFYMWMCAHPVLMGIGAFYLFSNAVQALPDVTPDSNKFYRWFYAFSHGVAGNVRYALRKAFPQYVDPQN